MKAFRPCALWATALCAVVSLQCSDGESRLAGAETPANGSPSEGAEQAGGGGEQGASGGGTGTGQGSCVSDRVTLPSDARCTCACTSCECAKVSCTCDPSCYAAGSQCIVSSDPAGNGTIGAGGPQCNGISCTPESDLSTTLSCTLSDCHHPLNNVQLSPATAPSTASQTFDRQAQNTGLLFLVDTSPSMQVKQMQSACAMDAFYKATANASFSVSVATMDILPLFAKLSPTNGTMSTTPPTVVGLAGACGVPQCNCSGQFVSPGCTFNRQPVGTSVKSGEPGAQDLLRKLIVQELNEQTQANPPFGVTGKQTCEGGLEKAFRIVLELLKQGRQAEVPNQVVAISDEEGWSDMTLCPVQAQRYSAPNVDLIKAVLGPGFNPPANSGDCKADLVAFYKYFFNSLHIKVNAIVDVNGVLPPGNSIGQIYIDVANATGGVVGDMAMCGNYTTFFNSIGLQTSTLSTQVCLGKPVDPATINVTYTAQGAGSPVPRSATDGWLYDAGTRCLQFSGSWADKLGSYSVSYKDPTQSTVASSVCFPSGVNPIPSTLQVSLMGAAVPQSATDGWTLDASGRCLDFHGSWAGKPGPFDVQYL